MPKNFTRYKLIFACMIFVGVISCRYDNEEDLYPNGCDTSNVTYSSTVTPILATYCNSCHNPNFPSDGVIVSTYAGLKEVVNDGRFWGSINHEAGYDPMPQGGDKLPDCDLQKIRKWIDDGALNN